MSAPTPISLLVATAIVFLPSPGHRVQRNTDMDIRKLQETDCEYRGITASFAELSRAYALRTYEEARLVRWEARPHTHNPDTESLITAVFEAAGPKPGGGQALSPAMARDRRRAPPSFGVTWCLRILGKLRVTPHNTYARDAVAVFRQTVDDFIARMVLVTRADALRAGPGPEHAEIAAVAAGAVLLQTEQQDHWVQVRIPETQTTGWIEKEGLIVISETR